MLVDMEWRAEWLVRRSVANNIIQLTALNGLDSSLSVWLTSYPRTISKIISSSLGWSHRGDRANPTWPPRWPEPPASPTWLPCYCYRIPLKERLGINHDDSYDLPQERGKVDGQRRSVRENMTPQSTDVVRKNSHLIRWKYSLQLTIKFCIKANNTTKHFKWHVFFLF